MSKSLYILLGASVGVLLVSLVYRYSWVDVPEEKKTVKLTSIAFKTRGIDIGKLFISDEVTANFTIYNTGDEYLYIDKVEVSCHCTSGEVPLDAVMPGDSVVIFVQYNKKKVGSFYQDILVYGNFESSPEILSFEGHLVE